MNDLLNHNDKKFAYLKYDKTFGFILEVALHNKLLANDSEMILTVDRNMGLKFLSGAYRLRDYVVIRNSDGNSSLTLREFNNNIRSFCELVDINTNGCQLKLVYSNFQQFEVSQQFNVISSSLVLYVTDKNDPNSLHHTIKFKDFPSMNANGTWTILVNLDDEYSIYVSD